MSATRSLLRRVGLVLAPPAVALLARTLRFRREEGPVAHLWAARSPAIYATWHARIVMLPWLYGARGGRVLTSRSRDGEVVVRLVQRFGLEAVRGSSSRGGLRGFRVLLASLKEGREVLVVPDGPRGPREAVKPGIVALSRLSGAPVVPVAVGASREWRLRSWDRFRIPKPFARCVVRMGEPILPSRDPGHDERMRVEVERALVELTARVDREARG